MNIKKIFKQFDYVLLFIVTVIFSLGLVTIASATNAVELGITRQVKMQLISFFLGLSIIALIQLINYDFITRFYIPLYILGLLFVALVYIPGIGIERWGSRRWIELGPIDIQVSEIAKITYIIFLAKMIDKNGGAHRFIDIFKCGLVLIPYFLLVLKQPDLGTSIVFVSITFGIMLVAGLKYRYVIAGILLLVILMPTFIYPNLGNHQKDRIDAYLNQEDMDLPGNYHVMQSKITIGSGGMYGKGFFQGEFHRLNYLPVQDSDFIFAVYIEETGFVGGLILILLYLAFLFRLIYMSIKVKDNLGKYLIVGVLFMFAFQIVENIGMTMGALPVTGITLPFFSYGSTSLVSCLIAVGIAESVYVRRKKATFSQ